MEQNRRAFLKTGIAGGLSAASASVLGAATSLPPTPAEIEGPFYPIQAQKDKDFDLTQIQGKDGVASGKHIYIAGLVVDTESNPVEDATVDLWQANAAGRYRHPHDKNPAPIDQNFQGWAMVPSGAKGEFRFKTVYPGAYPVGDGWIRPPHIHFKVSKRGYVELVTQMYFPGHELNKADRLLQAKGMEEQAAMIATAISDAPETYQFRIVIQKV
jgi:protocatechuate 3,4-dioxygenase, beta subunit